MVFGDIDFNYIAAFGRLLAYEFEHLFHYIPGGESEFLVKDLVGCRGSEMVEAEHLAVAPYDSA